MRVDALRAACDKCNNDDGADYRRTQKNASDSIMFTITFPIDMLMKFGIICQHIMLKFGDELICLKET